MEGAFKLNKSIIKVIDLIKEVKALIVPKAELKGLSCSIEVEEDVPKQINCDLRRVQQLLLNIGFNAVKYTFKGSITIKFYLNKSKTYFCINITDTGIAMSESDFERINKLFGLIDKELFSQLILLLFNSYERITLRI